MHNQNKTSDYLNCLNPSCYCPRCECGSANCSGWLGGSDKPSHAELALDDSEDEAEGHMYESDEDGGFTKVQQLSLEAEEGQMVSSPRRLL
jgi:hypothetical protein